jgi:transcriptional regulator with XRE-family HTH domain
MDVTPDQIRAARASLRLEQGELARRAHVSIVTIRRLEAHTGRERTTPMTFDGVRRALEQAGAEFIPDGVRRRRPRPRYSRNSAPSACAAPSGYAITSC